MVTVSNRRGEPHGSDELETLSSVTRWDERWLVFYLIFIEVGETYDLICHKDFAGVSIEDGDGYLEVSVLCFEFGLRVTPLCYTCGLFDGRAVGRSLTRSVSFVVLDSLSRGMQSNGYFGTYFVVG